MGELIADDHSLLLLLVLLFNKVHYFIEVEVLVDLLEGLGGFFCYYVHVLDYLEGILQALVVEGFDFALHFLGIIGNYLWTPVWCLFTLGVFLVEVDEYS